MRSARNVAERLDRYYDVTEGVGYDDEGGVEFRGLLFVGVGNHPALQTKDELVAVFIDTGEADVPEMWGAVHLYSEDELQEGHVLIRVMPT